MSDLGFWAGLGLGLALAFWGQHREVHGLREEIEALKADGDELLGLAVRAQREQRRAEERAAQAEGGAHG